MNNPKTNTRKPWAGSADYAIQRRKKLRLERMANLADGLQRWTPSESDLARFWSKLPERKPGECWQWTGCRDGKGYGFFTMKSQYVAAHRFSYFMANGPFPLGLVVLHSCDNPVCCNPAHLSIGTPKDNTHDAMRKGRLMNGSTNPFAKLNAAAVRFIRENPNTPMIQLATHFNVSHAAISGVRRNVSWKHVR